MSHSPMAQFAIKPLFNVEIMGQDIVVSNMAIWMLISLFTLLIFGLAATRQTEKPNMINAAGEMLYLFIRDLLTDNAGTKALPYLPFIFSLFVFILLGNLFGMLPYSFTTTSHIAVTFTFAIVIFLGVTFLGFYHHGLHYFSLFLPHGTPKLMAPFIMLVEMFAYLVRPISLSIRLAANMTAGHIVLKVIAGLAIMFPIFSLFPFVLLVALTAFEVFIALLQAYIFTILTCVYLNDALNLH